MEREILILLILISIFIRLFFLHPTFSDENFYFNTGKLITEGKVPYKDFFFAHPPLQIYTLALFFTLFGKTFIAGKILPILASSASVFIIYLLGKKLFDKKIGFLAAILFLFSFPFLAFSSIEYGFFPTLFLVLLSFYFLLERRVYISIILYLAATFFRFHALFYFPIFFFYLYYFQKKDFYKFTIGFFIPFLVIFGLLNFIFGSEFYRGTVEYHIFTKVLANPYRTFLSPQYWSVGLFYIFLSIISLVYAIENKNRLLIFLILTPIFIDFLIMSLLQPVFFHYFLLSVPFYSLAIAKGFLQTSEKLIKILIISVLVLAVYSNFQTIDFYLNPKHAVKFEDISKFASENIKPNETIFGEPIAVNYASFKNDLQVTENFYDSYLPHLVFDGEDKVIEKLEKNKPKIFVDVDLNGLPYYSLRPSFKAYLERNYNLTLNVTGIPNYLIYRLK